MGGVGGWNPSGDEFVAVLDSNGRVLEMMAFMDEEWLGSILPSLAQPIEGKGAKEIFSSQALVFEMLAKQVNLEAERARAEGTLEDDVMIYVANRFQDNYLATTIIVHEGQHALDDNWFSSEWFGDWEYRAKLSELAYGEQQFHALANMHHPGLGTEINDMHSIANSRIYTEIVRHIYDNAQQFPEIDTTKNIMMQLVALDEEQLRQIAIAIFETSYPEEQYSKTLR